MGPAMYESHQGGIRGISWDDAISISLGCERPAFSDEESDEEDDNDNDDIPPLNDSDGMLSEPRQEYREHSQAILGGSTLAFGGAADKCREEVADLETSTAAGHDKVLSAPLEPANSQNLEDDIQKISWDNSPPISYYKNSLDDSISELPTFDDLFGPPKAFPESQVVGTIPMALGDFLCEPYAELANLPTSKQAGRERAPSVPPRAPTLAVLDPCDLGSLYYQGNYPGGIGGKPREAEGYGSRGICPAASSEKAFDSRIPSPEGNSLPPAPSSGTLGSSSNCQKALGGPPTREQVRGGSTTPSGARIEVVLGTKADIFLKGMHASDYEEVNEGANDADMLDDEDRGEREDKDIVNNYDGSGDADDRYHPS